MSDPSEFKLEFDASEAAAAARAASDVERLADSLDHVASASAKTRSKTLIGGFGGISAGAKESQAALEKVSGYGIGQRRPAQLFAGGDFAKIQNHARALERLNKAHTATAPLSKAAGKAMRLFGASGAPLRKVTIEAAKTETALGRLFSITKKRTGSSVKATGSVLGAIWGQMGKESGNGLGSGMRQGASDAILSGLGTTAVVAGAAVAAAAVPVGVLATSMTRTALAAEQLKFGLDRITDGKGQQWWVTSSEYAKKFGLNVNEVAQNLMGMKAGGFSDDLAKRMFQQFADMRSQGASSENIGNALIGLKQLRAAGTATAEDLNQVTENLSLSKGLVWEQLAKTLKKTPQEAKKLQEAGKITSDQMIEAISSAIGIQTKSAKPGDAGSAAVNATTLGAWDRLKAVFSVVSADTLGGDALKPLRDGIVKFTAWLEGGGGSKLISTFGNMLGKAFEYAPSVIDKVIWLLDTAIPDAWETFKLAFNSDLNTAVWSTVMELFRGLAGDDGNGAVTALQGLANVAGVAFGALSILAGGIATVIAGVTWLTQQISDTSSWEIFLGILAGLTGPIGVLAFTFGEVLVRGVSSAISGLGSAISDALVGSIRSAVGSAQSFLASTPLIGRFFKVGVSASDGMAQGMTESSGGVYAAGAALGNAATGGTADATQTHSPSRVMADLGVDNGSGYSLGIDSTVPRVADSGAAIGEAAAKSAGAVPIEPSVVGVTTVSAGASTVARSPLFSAAPSSSGFAPATPSASGPSILQPVSQTVNSGASGLSKPAPWAATGVPVFPAGQPAVAPVVSGSAAQMSAALGGASETVSPGVSGSAAAISASAAQIAPSTAQPAGGTATIQLQLDVHLTGEGANAAAQGQQIGSAAMRVIEPELAQLLRRFNYSGV